jgi:hypothetical protein
MTSIDVFYQGEGIREIAHFEADLEHSFATIKLAIIERHGLERDRLLEALTLEQVPTRQLRQYCRNRKERSDPSLLRRSS